MEPSKKYGPHVDLPMESQMVSWLKEVGYRGEALKAGNLRRLCNDEQVIDALNFMMQRMRGKEEARVFRTQLRQYESLEESRQASEKVMAARLREARKELRVTRGRRQAAYLECQSKAKVIKGLQEALVEQESRWQYEASVSLKDKRVRHRALRSFADKVTSSAEEMKSRTAGIKELVKHARQHREQKVTAHSTQEQAQLKMHAKKMLNVLNRAQGEFIGNEPRYNAVGNDCNFESSKLRGFELSMEVKEELGKLLMSGGGYYSSHALREAASGAQKKLIDLATELDSSGYFAHHNFVYPQAMIDRLQSQHLRESINKEALLNEAEENESVVLESLKTLVESVSDERERQFFGTMAKMLALRSDIEAIKSSIGLIHRKYGTHGHSLRAKLRNLQERCQASAVKSMDLDRSVEEGLMQVARVKSRIQKVRDSDNNYYAFKIIHQCSQAIQQAQIPLDLIVEVDAMEHMQLSTRLLRSSNEMDAILQQAKRTFWQTQEAGRPHILQFLNWAHQYKYSSQVHSSSLDTKQPIKWRWLKVIDAMNNPTASVWDPQLLLKKIFKNARGAESTSILLRNLSEREIMLSEAAQVVNAALASCQHRCKYLHTEHSENVWDALDSVSHRGSSLHYELQSVFKPLLENYKNLPFLKKANFILLAGPDGKKGTLSYWMSLWDDATGFLNYRRGLGSRHK